MGSGGESMYHKTFGNMKHPNRNGNPNKIAILFGFPFRSEINLIWQIANLAALCADPSVILATFFSCNVLITELGVQEFNFES